MSNIENRIVAYLRPRTFKMLIAQSYLDFNSKSQKSSNIIEKHFNSLPIKEQEALIALYNEMPETSKKRTKSS